MTECEFKLCIGYNVLLIYQSTQTHRAPAKHMAQKITTQITTRKTKRKKTQKKFSCGLIILVEGAKAAIKSGWRAFQAFQPAEFLKRRRMQLRGAAGCNHGRFLPFQPGAGMVHFP
jgi:hypothetical protein